MQNTCRHILPEAGPPKDAAPGLMANPVRYDRIPLDQVPSAVLTWSVCWHLSEHKKKVYPYVNPNTQRPVTREFWKLYMIWPRYSTFKHFNVGWVCAKIVSLASQQWNMFRVCSASGEICSAYVQLILDRHESSLHPQIYVNKYRYGNQMLRYWITPRI